MNGEALAFALLALMAVTDARSRRLPLWATWGLLALGLALGAAGGAVALGWALASALLAVAPLWLLRRAPRLRPGLGGGDLRLALGLGAWLGAPLALAVLALAAGAAALAGHALRRPDQPFAPWALAALLVLHG